jgi:predicted nucleotidyltransferase
LADKTENSELDQLAELLAKHGVEYIVIGGQAEILHGSARTTEDIDLCYRRTKENLTRLADALRVLKPSLRGAPPDLPFILDAKTLEMGSNFTLSTHLIDLDLLGYVEPLGGYDEVKNNAVRFMSRGLELWTISLDDLLRVKLHINRPKDQESIAQLRAIIKLHKDLTTQRGNTPQ